MYFWPCYMACAILVPQLWVKPVSPAVEAWNPNYWTTRKFPECNLKEVVEWCPASLFSMQ